jgi:hypothetical protein
MLSEAELDVDGLTFRAGDLRSSPTPAAST